ncbi:MAG TPA: homoserine kinase [Blastocatellia bacterium]|nr:homoserine kinase [Blastocatellia bacterium]
MTEIIVPASTSNLGASFDACGLALALYLRVKVEPDTGFHISAAGEGAQAMPRDETNLIARVARAVASSRGTSIDGARLSIRNEIPLARGLGSSSAAIVAGISVYETLAGERLGPEEFFRHALRFEEHGDNLAPSLFGGLVVACLSGDDDRRSLITLKRDWPEEVKIVLAIPDYEMETARMRAVLPERVPRADAIFNLQRSALLQALIAERRFDLLSEALRDRLHQPHRAPLAAGLSDVLKMNDEAHLHRGLLGVAISGAGSTIIAFATGATSDIAAQMAARFKASNVEARTLEVAVDNNGRQFSGGSPASV